MLWYVNDFLFKAAKYSIGCIHHTFFIRSSVDRHFSFFLRFLTPYFATGHPLKLNDLSKTTQPITCQFFKDFIVVSWVPASAFGELWFNLKLLG